MRLESPPPLVGSMFQAPPTGAPHPQRTVDLRGTITRL